MGRWQQRRNKGRVLNGWLVIHKPTGLSSGQAVARVKAIARAAKVGHGGTLDPFSEGLLPMALGEATKMLSLVLEGDKSYRCWIRFGTETETGDPTGRVVGQTDYLPEQPALEAALQHFTGVQQQVPPAYSSIHVNGVRSYELARRGEAVPLPARQVVIQSLRLESYVDGLAQVSVDCGKGTYMRSLAQDLGRHLGSLAHLEQLLRTRTLGFSLEQSVTPEELSALVSESRLGEILLPIDRVLDDIPALRLQEESWYKIVNGQAVWVEIPGSCVHSPSGEWPSQKRKLPEEVVRLLTPEGRFGGVGVLTKANTADQTRLCQLKRLFRS